MDAELAGKSALITGASSGIGRSIALALAREGAHIAIADIRRDDLLLEEIAALGVQVHFLTIDVSNESQVRQMVSRAIKSLGQVDLFVNNAAVARHEAITHITTDAWLATLHTNLSACIWACRDLCPHMITRGTGSILIVGSTAQYNQAYQEASYHISKAGLRVFKNTLALEMAPHGIRVNLLVPGHFNTPLTQGISEQKASIMRMQIPLRRFGMPDELGAAAVLLLSDRLSPYTTGAEFTVDGGLHLRPLPLNDDETIRAMNQPPAE